nr:GAF domain-containing sensor histidine kinase [uncultured Nevskia sp.]
MGENQKVQMRAVELDVQTVGRISAVPSILEMICRSTGLRFAAVARVTDATWTLCAVRDELAFGLQPGDDLELKSTLCHEVRLSGAPIMIDHVAEDPVFKDHHTPRQYGFESYISYPIVRSNGEHFGTLCALDPKPARLGDSDTLKLFELYSQLISLQLDVEDRLRETQAIVSAQQETAQLREQFIAVLGHDLRNPLSSMMMSAEVLLRTPLVEQGMAAAKRIKTSGHRMAQLIENLMDFARGRLGGGIVLAKESNRALEATLSNIVAELTSIHPGRQIELLFDISEPVFCDSVRIGQLLSNLLGNALTHGDTEGPVRVVARCRNQIFSLAVSNAGTVIPADILKRLFEPFYRVADGHEHPGLGLGLFIASEIAKAHSGTLTVLSEPSGTTFTLTMPADLA